MLYDYIFCGYGLSAQLVLHRLACGGSLSDKSVLILDHAKRETKTVCFWERGDGPLDGIIGHEWSRALFISDKPIEILAGQNRYKLLDPSRLEDLVTETIRNFHAIEFKTENVTALRDNGHFISVVTDVARHTGKKVFSSLPTEIPNTQRYPLLLQHFTGWMVETQKPVFTADTATFMDFSVAQEGATRFVYVLPISSTKALVEYTLFSPATLEAGQYEAGIAHYLEAKGIRDYRITAVEKGVIPMSAYPFWKRNKANLLHIGTAGGWTKASTGYTLMYAQKQAAKIEKFLRSGDADFTKFHKSDRFHWYDRIFVSVLYHENASGKHIFSTLFRRADPGLVLKFLREETSVMEDIVVLASCPKRLFVKHLSKRLFNRIGPDVTSEE